MPARPPRFLGIALLVLIVAAAGVGWWWLTVGRWPLGGGRFHDFGQVEVAGSTTSRSHTFVLRNRRSTPITVVGARASCGCTSAVIERTVLQPGDRLEVPVTLHLDRPGERTSSIQILMEEETEPFFLNIRGVARRSESLEILEPEVRLVAGEPHTTMVLARLQDSDDPPPALLLTPPPGVTAEFTGWTLSAPRQGLRATAALWKGTIVIRTEAEDLPESGCMLGVGLPGRPRHQIRLRTPPVLPRETWSEDGWMPPESGPDPVRDPAHDPAPDTPPGSPPAADPGDR
ncbi:MAG: DUF1573 domain-containing protein [Phycisphaeraceae bacterium]|nr:DUF1573 domain-containing protein [Phycisphaeraceae bacterium]